MLIPRPLSPLAAFAYYLLSKETPEKGSLLGRHYARWTLATRQILSEGEPVFNWQNVIVNLNVPESDLRKLVEKHLDTVLLTFAGFHHRRKVMNFFFFGKQFRAAWDRWFAFTGKLSRHDQAASALSACVVLFDRIFTESLLPISLDSELKVDVPSPFRHVNSEAYRVLTIPVSKRNDEIEDDHFAREIYKRTKKSLLKAPIANLAGDKTIILVGGDPNLGKSTLAPALFEQMRDEIESIQSEREFAGLNLRISYVSLDEGTPVSDAVLKGEGRDRELMTGRKQPWSVELAARAIKKVELAMADADIIITDLPGKVTDITKLLSTYATLGIFLGPTKMSEWKESKDRWKAFFREIGLPVVARIKSTLGVSMMIELREEKMLYGRVHQPMRLITGSDSFIRQAAEFLLFNIIPGRLHRVHAQIEEQAGKADHL